VSTGAGADTSCGEFLQQALPPPGAAMGGVSHGPPAGVPAARRARPGQSRRVPRVPRGSVHPGSCGTRPSPCGSRACAWRCWPPTSTPPCCEGRV